MRPAIPFFIAALAAVVPLSAADKPAPCPAAAECLRDLKSPVAGVRASAARRLGELGDRGAADALIAALGDGQAAVRREAAKALAALRDARAGDALAKALGDDDATVRFNAAYALGEIKSPASADALIAALGDPQWCVRNQAAWALREICDPRAARRLADALKRKDADVGQIVWILRRSKGEAIVEALTGMLRRPQAPARARAARALGELGGAKAVAPLIAALGDEALSVRRAAVEALARIGDRRAAQPLAQAAQREKDPALREAARQLAERLSRHPDLLAHWSFDDGGAKVAKDASGRGSDGRVIGCKVVKGRIGSALRFGPGSYVELGKPAAVPVGQSPLTIAAWARPEAPNGVVVARGGAFCGFSLYVKGGAAKFGIHRVEDGPAYIVAGKEKVVGRWVHLAGVVRKDGIELYVDGRLAATGKTAGYLPGNCGQGMEIGFDVGNSAAEIVDHFVGVIDEVKVYRAALSAEEIARQCHLAGKERAEKKWKRPRCCFVRCVDV